MLNTPISQKLPVESKYGGVAKVPPRVAEVDMRFTFKKHTSSHGLMTFKRHGRHPQQKSPYVIPGFA